MLWAYLLTIFIVGFVTAGINIRFDRFFTILLLLFIFKLNIFQAVDVFLWVIMLGALMILLHNAKTIMHMPTKNKLKFFVYVPIMTLIASLIGSYAFSIASQTILIGTLGVLAVLYGIRLMIIHFEEYEHKFEEGHALITKICGLLGPLVSGFFIGFIGTSLKPLKIPFAVKIGKMNIKKTYLGNTITAFFASFFAIIWHLVLIPSYGITALYQNLLLGMALWAGIHYVFEITNLFFKDKWRKLFQIAIGFILLLVSLRVFGMII